MATASRICTAFSAAAANASEMTVGWIPRSSRSRHFFSSAPQITVTDVVPSPATTSCAGRAVQGWLATAWWSVTELQAATRQEAGGEML